MGKIIAYKGFDKDLKCRGFQYEVGKTYELPNGEKPIACKVGFHACENPLDVLNYYGDIANNRFCVVEQSSDFDKKEDKTASSRIKVKAEIGFIGLFKAGIEWLKKVTKDAPTNDNGEDYAKIGSSDGHAKIGSSGDFAKIGSSGEVAQIGSSGASVNITSSGHSASIGSSGGFAHIASSGSYSIIASIGNYANVVANGHTASIGSSGDFARVGSSGDFAKIESIGDFARIGSIGESAKIDSTGENSVICCLGYGSSAKAKRGSWITLAEWKYDKDEKRLVPKCVKTEYVDGERIKADTWYKLVDGEFVEQ